MTAREAILMVGYLSAEMPELHGVEAYRLIEVANKALIAINDDEDNDY